MSEAHEFGPSSNCAKTGEKGSREGEGKGVGEERIIFKLRQVRKNKNGKEDARSEKEIYIRKKYE